MEAAGVRAGLGLREDRQGWPLCGGGFLLSGLWLGVGGPENSLPAREILAGTFLGVPGTLGEEGEAFPGSPHHGPPQRYMSPELTPGLPLEVKA